MIPRSTHHSQNTPTRGFNTVRSNHAPLNKETFSKQSSGHWLCAPMHDQEDRRLLAALEHSQLNTAWTPHRTPNWPLQASISVFRSSDKRQKARSNSTFSLWRATKLTSICHQIVCRRPQNVAFYVNASTWMTPLPSPRAALPVYVSLFASDSPDVPRLGNLSHQSHEESNKTSHSPGLGHLRARGDMGG